MSGLHALRWPAALILLLGAAWLDVAARRSHRRAVLLGMVAASGGPDDPTAAVARPATSWRAAPWSRSIVARSAELSRGALLGATVLGGVLGAALGGAFGAIVAVALCATAVLLRWAHRLAEPRRYDRALLVVVEALGRQLRSGATVIAALGAAGESAPPPVRDDLLAVHRALGAGATLEEAVQAWAAARPRATVQLVCATLALGAASGGLRARMVDEVAQWLRQLDGARREAAALAGQAEASAVVMVVAPLAFAALLAAGDPQARQFLTGSALGLGCLGLGLALDLVAAACMARIVVGAR